MSPPMRKGTIIVLIRKTDVKGYGGPSFASTWLKYSLSLLTFVVQVFMSTSGSLIREHVARIFVDIHIRPWSWKPKATGWRAFRKNEREVSQNVE